MAENALLQFIYIQCILIILLAFISLYNEFLFNHTPFISSGFLSSHPESIGKNNLVFIWILFRQIVSPTKFISLKPFLHPSHHFTVSISIIR